MKKAETKPIEELKLPPAIQGHARRTSKAQHITDPVNGKRIQQRLSGHQSIHIRVTQEEKDLIRAEAKKAGLSLSKWVLAQVFVTFKTLRIHVEPHRASATRAKIRNHPIFVGNPRGNFEAVPCPRCKASNYLPRKKGQCWNCGNKIIMKGE